jgi:hypothetical protein
MQPLDRSQQAGRTGLPSLAGTAQSRHPAGIPDAAVAARIADIGGSRSIGYCGPQRGEEKSTLEPQQKPRPEQKMPRCGFVCNCIQILLTACLLAHETFQLI